MIYFLRAGDTDFIKIGYAADVSRRVALLQAGNHLPLTVIREMPGGRDLEGAFHRLYSARRVAREWFRFCPTMMHAVAELPPPAAADGTPQHPSLIELGRAAELLGSRVKLSDAIGVKRTTLQSWFADNRPVPAEVCTRVELATAGQVRRSDLRPDLWAAA